MSNEQIILEVKGLTKRFYGLVAVNDLNFQVKKGRIHALIGPNGAGKTTMCIRDRYWPDLPEY